MYITTVGLEFRTVTTVVSDSYNRLLLLVARLLDLWQCFWKVVLDEEGLGRIFGWEAVDLRHELVR